MCLHSGHLYLYNVHSFSQLSHVVFLKEKVDPKNFVFNGNLECLLKFLLIEIENGTYIMLIIGKGWLKKKKILIV